MLTNLATMQRQWWRWRRIHGKNKFIVVGRQCIESCATRNRRSSWISGMIMRTNYSALTGYFSWWDFFKIISAEHFRLSNCRCDFNSLCGEEYAELIFKFLILILECDKTPSTLWSIIAVPFVGVHLTPAIVEATGEYYETKIEMLVEMTTIPKWLRSYQIYNWIYF